MTNPLVIYHARCMDGMTAAWAVWKALGAGDYVPATHGDAPPEVDGRDVVVVDFAYSRPVMEDILKRARSLRVLDHHKSAEADLAGLPGTTFDMQRSGAGLAWDWFHPGHPRPMLVNLVEDNDLWHHALPGSREFQLRLEIEPMNFEAWDRIGGMSAHEIEALVAEGRILKRAFDLEVAELLKNSYPVTLGNEAGIAVNAVHRYASEVGHHLAALSGTFGMVWYLFNGRLKVSLRSSGDYDVSELAAQFGGGGHRNAASFTLPLEDFALVSGKAA